MHQVRAFNDRSGSDEVAVTTGEEEKKDGRGQPPDDLVSTPLRERAGDFLPGVRERRVWRGRRTPLPATQQLQAKDFPRYLHWR